MKTNKIKIAGILAAVIVFSSPIIASATAGKSINSTNTNQPLSAISTSTLNYLPSGGTATTTLPLYTGDTDQLDFNIILQSSTTSSVAKYRFEFSNDFTNWFPQTEATSSIEALTLSSHTWQFSSTTFAGTSGNVTPPTYNDNRHIVLKDINSLYTRIVFFLAQSSAPANVWIQSTQKSNNVN